MCIFINFFVNCTVQVLHTTLVRKMNFSYPPYFMKLLTFSQSGFKSESNAFFDCDLNPFPPIIFLLWFYCTTESFFIRACLWVICPLWYENFFASYYSFYSIVEVFYADNVEINIAWNWKLKLNHTLKQALGSMGNLIKQWPRKAPKAEGARGAKCPPKLEFLGFIAFLCDNFWKLRGQLPPLPPWLRGHWLD